MYVTCRDGDGDADLFDNCQQTPNADQSDVDNDGIGRQSLGRDGARPQ